jgi:hypothetical protein
VKITAFVIFDEAVLAAGANNWSQEVTGRQDSNQRPPEPHLRGIKCKIPENHEHFGPFGIPYILWIAVKSTSFHGFLCPSVALLATA